MRKPFLAGNWKMNKTVDEAVELAKELVKEAGLPRLEATSVTKATIS